MTIHHLPEDIFPGTDRAEDSIIIHEYAAMRGSFKGRSVLHKNAISLVIKGEKTMRFAEKTVSANDREIHFLSCGNCLASMDLSKQELFRSVLIFFDNKVLTDFYVKYDALVNRMKGNRVFSPQAYLSFRKDAFIDHFIASLILLTQGGRPISQEMRSLKFEELMLHLVERHPEKLLAFQVLKKDGLEDFQIRKAVESNIVSPITVEELAFVCNMSLSTFKRRFERIYGSSPNKWILLRRMEMAKELLLHQNEKPGEVYYKVGYESHSGFTQAFKQVYGITPKDFRMNAEVKI